MSGDPLSEEKNCSKTKLISKYSNYNSTPANLSIISYEPPVIGKNTQEHCCRRLLSVLTADVELEEAKEEAKTLLYGSEKNEKKKKNYSY
jgi:hypothetical protein